MGRITVPWDDLELTGPEVACLAADLVVGAAVLKSGVPVEAFGPNADLSLRFTTAPAVRATETSGTVLRSSTELPPSPSRSRPASTSSPTASAQRCSSHHVPDHFAARGTIVEKLSYVATQRRAQLPEWDTRVSLNGHEYLVHSRCVAARELPKMHNGLFMGTGERCLRRARWLRRSMWRLVRPMSRTGSSVTARSTFSTPTAWGVTSTTTRPTNSVHSLAGLASFSRLIFFDRRGTGASDALAPNAMPPWEEWVDDVGAVLEAAGSERTVIYAALDVGPIAIMFAALQPERVTALILENTSARYLKADDYPIGMSRAAVDAVVETVSSLWGTQELANVINPAMADNLDFLRLYAARSRASATPRNAAAAVPIHPGERRRSLGSAPDPGSDAGSSRRTKPDGSHRPRSLPRRSHPRRQVS